MGKKTQKMVFLFRVIEFQPEPRIREIWALTAWNRDEAMNQFMTLLRNSKRDFSHRGDQIYVTDPQDKKERAAEASAVAFVEKSTPAFVAGVINRMGCSFAVTGDTAEKAVKARTAEMAAVKSGAHKSLQYGVSFCVPVVDNL